MDAIADTGPEAGKETNVSVDSRIFAYTEANTSIILYFLLWKILDLTEIVLYPGTVH